jgi:hypothetical protein
LNGLHRNCLLNTVRLCPKLISRFPVFCVP